jgi:hypothetical protein
MSLENHRLEYFDFNNPATTSTAQTHKSTLRVSKDGTINALACFIGVDFGDQYTSTRCQTSNKAPALNPSLDNSRGPSFTSHRGDQAHATNWRNPTIILQSPLTVRSGDTITISTTVDASTRTPSYTFTIEAPPNSSTGTQTHTLTPPTQTITLNFSSLYPTYTPTERTPPGTDPLLNPNSLRLSRYYGSPPSPCLTELPRPATNNPSPQQLPHQRAPETPHQHHPQRLALEPPNPPLSGGAGSSPSKRPKNVNSTIGTHPAIWSGQGSTMNHTLTAVAADHTRTGTDLPMFCPTVEMILRSHLHLEGTVNTHISHVEPGERWHSTNTHLAAIGATTGPLEKFLLEQSTWINLRPPSPCSNTQLTHIISAINTSTRARIAGLFHLTDEHLALHINHAATTHTRLCRLATFPPHTITLLTPRKRELSSSLEKSTNELPIHLLLAETVAIQPIDVATLRTALHAISPTTTVHIPWSYPSSNFTLSTRRTCLLRHPTLFFLHPLTFLINPRDNLSHIETHNRVAAALGILPKNLPKLLKYHRHQLEIVTLDTHTLVNIRAILRNAAVASYTRYEKFMKKDLFGDYG